MELSRLKKRDETTFTLSTTCGYYTTIGSGLDHSCVFHYDDMMQATRIPMNTTSYSTFRGCELSHHSGLSYSFDSEYVYLDDRNMNILAWGGASGDVDYKARRTYAAHNLWPNNQIPDRLTVTEYAQRLISQGRVRDARRNNVIDIRVEAEIQRIRNS